MKVRIAVVLGVTVALVLPAIAGAALPKTSNHLIVPNQSIGSVRLGAKLSAVLAAWGHPKQNCEKYFCNFEGAKPKTGTPAIASVGLEEKVKGKPPKVWTISLNVPQKEVKGTFRPDFNTPLTEFKTAKGIGLGSTVGALKNAYKGMKKYGTAPSYSYTLEGPGNSQTVFVVNGTKITTIAVQSHPGG